MASDDSTIDRWISSAVEWRNEQLWYQQIKSKWDELDPQSRIYLQLAIFAGSLLVTLFIVFSFIWSVSRLKHEYTEKAALLNTLQNANEELRHLRDTNASISSAATSDPWPLYLETQAGTSGITKPNLTISDGVPGAKGDQVSEMLFDISLKKVNIRQVVRYIYALESGSRPVKLRNLQIDTKEDPTGYMDASLAVSGFAVNSAAGK